VEEYYLIAKIISLYGNKGSVKIASYSDFPDRFFKLDKVFIDFFGAKKVFTVESVEQENDSFILKFKNFDTKADSEVLIGKEIYVDSLNLVELPADTFFIHDLIGTEVFMNGNSIGKITDVITLPSNDVYVINNNNGEELLIPALKSVLKSFDAEKKIMILNPDSVVFDDDEN